MNKPTQNKSPRTFAKLVATAAFAIVALAVPMTVQAGGLPEATVSAENDQQPLQNYWMASVSWGGCSSCSK